MATSLIRGRYLVVPAASADTVEALPNAAIVQRDGAIVEIGPYATLKAGHRDVPELGSGRHVVLPGFVNAHHHNGHSNTLLGCLDGPLELWLSEMWAKRDVDLYLDTLYGCMHLLRSGVTTVMHNLTRFIPPAGGALLADSERILAGYRDAGMRVAYSVAMKETNRIVYGDDDAFLRRLPATLAEALRARMGAASLSGEGYLALWEELHRAHAAAGGDRVRVFLSPANVQWVSDKLLQRIKDVATRARTGIHMHLAETPYQQAYGPRTLGRTPAAHLAALGVLGPEVSCAHGVYLSDPDMDLLAAAGTIVSHNPSSNLRLSSGIARLHQMRARGVTVALGVDSNGLNDDHDMLAEARLAFSLHRRPGLDAPVLAAGQVLTMATRNGARACLLGDRVGSLEVGKRADLVLVDLDRVQDPADASVDLPVLDLLVRRAKPAHVDMVLVDGEVVFADGKFTRIDEQAVLGELRRRLAEPLKPHEQERRALAAALRPWIRAFYTDWSLDA